MSKDYAEGSLLVILKDDVDASALDNKIAQRGGTISDRVTTLYNGMTIQFNPGDEQAWIAWLNAQPEVDEVELEPAAGTY